MMAMVTIVFVLSKFVSAYGQAKDYPAREQRERFQSIGATPLTTGRIGAVQPVMVEAMQLIYP